MTDTELYRLALGARVNAYAPYSHFSVGAALLSPDGRVFTGCNIENSAFSPGICAERAAFARAVSDGCRNFTAIAVAGAPEGVPAEGACMPCGVCRQFMSEFCGADFRIVTGGDTCVTLGELLPHVFSLA